MTPPDPKAPEWEIEASREIRDKLVELSQRHERETHGGEACPEHRVGLVAFLTHALGLSSAHLPLVEDALDEYERQHSSLHGNGDHSHGA